MQPHLSITPEGTHFRDLNRNGILDQYEDPRLPVSDRVEDLIQRLSIREKAGLLFHQVITVGTPGDHDVPGPFGPETERELVCVKGLSHFNVHEFASGEAMATWQNKMQKLAETATPHGIPITFSSDPRHGFSQNEGMSFRAGAFSQWPEPIGFAAIGSVDLVREFAEIARDEYLAVGLRAALHPQLDLATEPRWARQVQTFGSNVEVATEMAVAFLQTFQGESLSPRSVACTIKHFPGGGPQKDGEDPHFPYGREQIYPGDRFEYHLRPFREAITAGASAVMPYYALPEGLSRHGTRVPEVGFSFNHYIVKTLLRDELGFRGVVLTDWQLATDLEMFGLPFPAKAWGVEYLDVCGRLAALLDAGVDQFGGESSPELLVELIESGRIMESRVDESVRRVLRVKFELGLFDNPFVDEEKVESLVGTSDHNAAGHRAQAAAITVLKNDGVLPLSSDARIYVEGVDEAVAGLYGDVVRSPADADLAIVRLAAPFEERNDYFLEAMTHQGSLEYPPGVVEHLRALAEQVPLVIDVFLDRPAILGPLDALARGVVVDFGASDRALLDAITGRIAPRGRLPFEIPRSMAAVIESRPDVPNDTENPLYPCGSGLDIGERGILSQRADIAQPSEASPLSDDLRPE